MPRQYCHRCAAEVPVDDGVCFFGHEVDTDAADVPPGAESDRAEGDDVALREPFAAGSGHDDVDEALFAARPDEDGPAVDGPDVTPDAVPPEEDVDRESVDTGDAPSEPAATDGPDGPAPADDGDSVDVSALEAAIAELESREVDGVRAPADDTGTDDEISADLTDVDAVAEPEEPAATASAATASAATPSDEPEIDDLLDGGDFGSDLTWEGEVEIEPDSEDEAPDDASAVDGSSWAAEEDGGDGAGAFEDWDLDDWSDETDPAATAVAASPDDEPTADDEPGWDDDLALTGEDGEPLDAPPADAVAPGATPAAPPDDEDADDRTRDEHAPAIDPTSFTARDRKRKGLLSRLFG